MPVDLSYLTQGIENEKIIQKINKIKNESVYLNSLLNSEIQKQNELKKKVNILITNKK